jgi:hypothetical protein
MLIVLEILFTELLPVVFRMNWFKILGAVFFLETQLGCRVARSQAVLAKKYKKSFWLRSAVPFWG